MLKKARSCADRHLREAKRKGGKRTVSISGFCKERMRTWAKAVWQDREEQSMSSGVN